MQVGEVDCQRLPATHFFTIHQNLVTAWGNLKRAKEEEISLVEFGTVFMLSLTRLTSNRLDSVIFIETDAAAVAFLKHSLERVFIRTFMLLQQVRYFVTDYLHFYSSC